MRRFRFPVIMLMMFFLSLNLIACGGGGGGDSGSSTNVIPLKTSTIRDLESGDSWQMSVTGTINDGVDTVSVSGTMTQQVLSTMVQSPITLDFCQDLFGTMILTGPGGSVTIDSHTYFKQDVSGSVYEYGEMNPFTGDIWIVMPTDGYILTWQSPMAVGQSYGSTIVFNDGSSMTTSYSVDAIENVSTGIGTFEAYRISESMTYDYGIGDRDVAVSTIWIVPGLGEVKEDIDLTYYSFGVPMETINLTGTLTSTNVTY